MSRQRPRFSFPFPPPFFPPIPAGFPGFPRPALPPPPVIVAPPAADLSKKTKKTKAKTKNKTKDFFEDLWTSFSTAFNSPHIIAVLIISVGVVVTHISDPQSGPLSGVISNLKNNTNTESLGNWLSENLVKFVGIIIFIPAVVSIPEKNRATIGILSLLWVYIIPEATYLQYSLQALVLVLFNRMKGSTHRMMLVGILVALYFLGNISLLYPHKTGETAPSGTPSNPAGSGASSRVRRHSDPPPVPHVDPVVMQMHPNHHKRHDSHHSVHHHQNDDPKHHKHHTVKKGEPNP